MKRTITLLLAIGCAAAVAVVAETVPGDQWEVTSQMSMEGAPMKFPENKVKICSPTVWTEPPGAADQRMRCTNSDFHQEGTKVTWKTTCAGPPAMTGEGEIVRDGDSAWAGKIKFTGGEANMTLNLSGRRLGDCEAKK
jgi:uncharacterized protein DUF3617